VEVAYTNLGEVSARGPGGTASAEATAFEFVGLGMAPVAERVSLYGKAGIYRSEVDARIDTLTLVGSASESNVGFTFGAGAAFHLIRQASLRVEWQRYLDVGGDDTGEDDLDVLSLGVLFRF
jgi:OOP family OmpA-OmpF porin